MLVHKQDLRADEAHAANRHGGFVELHQELHLGVERHLERIALDRVVPAGHDLVGVGEDDFARGEDRVGARDGHGLFGHGARGGGFDAIRRGKSPRAIDEHAQDVLYLSFAGGDRLAAIAADPDVGVRGAELRRLCQGGVGNFGARGIVENNWLERFRPVGYVRGCQGRGGGGQEFTPRSPGNVHAADYSQPDRSAHEKRSDDAVRCIGHPADTEQCNADGMRFTVAFALMIVVQVPGVAAQQPTPMVPPIEFTVEDSS